MDKDKHLSHENDSHTGRKREDEISALYNVYRSPGKLVLDNTVVGILYFKHLSREFDIVFLSFFGILVPKGTNLKGNLL